MVEDAPAKINLALHVTGQRGDGFHLLDSLVVFAGIGDRLQFENASTLSLTVTGPMAAGVPSDKSNLILKAAALFGTSKGARITLDKRLPHAAGIGGGSADAAATLRGLSRLWQCDLPGTEACLGLGADLPVCLAAKPQRMRGIGGELSDIPALPPLFAVLINPMVPVPTAGVFQGLERKDNPAMETPDWQDFDSFIAWLKRQRNDLETPAFAITSEVSETLQTLRGDGAVLARMSGSGATCFGLYKTRVAANAAAARLSIRHPHMWIVATDILN